MNSTIVQTVQHHALKCLPTATGFVGRKHQKSEQVRFCLTCRALQLRFVIIVTLHHACRLRSLNRGNGDYWFYIKTRVCGVFNVRGVKRINMATHAFNTHARCAFSCIVCASLWPSAFVPARTSLNPKP